MDQQTAELFEQAKAGYNDLREFVGHATGKVPAVIVNRINADLTAIGSFLNHAKNIMAGEK